MKKRKKDNFSVKISKDFPFEASVALFVRLSRVIDRSLEIHSAFYNKKDRKNLKLLQKTRQKKRSSGRRKKK